MEKYVKLTEKALEAKIMMQSSFSDNCARVYNIDLLNLFNRELHLINTKPVIQKQKLKDLLDELKKFKAQAILILDYKKIDNQKPMRKIFYWSSKELAVIQPLIKYSDQCIKA